MTAPLLGAALLLLGDPQGTVVPMLVPGHGLFSLQLPARWKEVSRSMPAQVPPSVAFERSGAPRGSLELTVIWDPKGEPGFSGEASLRRLALRAQEAVRANAVERELPLVAMQGLQGRGFRFTATDRTYVAAGKPTPGEYPILTHGMLAVGNAVVSFTLLSDAKDDAAVKEALAAMHSAALATEPRDSARVGAPGKREER